ncbi:PQQ-binding-like beta-propeller repeat protein [Sandaracinus amylolyticus]|uniref:outer membrane protein assembly factor BamB family protein n=1 Tax=Sandaracinus amylolyticus TaxID=927083 RepID=UPI001F31E4B2|nr:PQQ-binding-like beta-propeller repeat protein [Sandaracinus amylolyticus]UJR80541.1 Basic proline-rich protein [Sandaracinus amylolyticus]
MISLRRVSMLALIAALSGCGAGTQAAFSHQFADNQAEDIAAVLERLPDPRPHERPENALGEPLVIASTHGEGRRVVAIAPDGTERWSQAIDTQTRPEILGDVVLVSDRQQLVALDLRTGAQRWTQRLADLAYVGATRDGDTIYYAATVGALGGARRVGHVAAVDAQTGTERWRHEVQGVFGQPAASGGMVMVPWERQNLAILDETTGTELARLRSTDDVLAWTFEDPTGVYYGHRSVYRMTHRSVSGQRAESTHRELPIPQLPVLHEGEVAREVELFDDGFLPKPGTRSARGRIRLYFTPGQTASPEEVAILGDTVYFVYYRYAFAYDLEGNMRWARILEQDVIGAQATADGLFVVGEQGRMRVLDRASGLDRWTGGSELQLASVALDVTGFAPGAAPEGEAPALRASLSAIAVDPDNRLVPARAYAIQQLAAMEDPEITRDLLDLYAQQSMPGALRQAIGNSLRARRTGSEHLVEALARRYDFLDDTQAPPLEVIVPSLLEMRATQAVPGLVQQMNDHETPAAVLPTVVRAVVELGDASVVPALRQFLVLYHADTTFAEHSQALAAAAEGVFRHGGPEGREMLTALAAEPRTVGALRESIGGYFEAERQQQEALARREVEEAERAAQEAARQEEAALPGRLTQEQIDQTFAGHVDPLRECVAGEIGRNPLLGQVRLVFILNNDGHAQEIGVAPNTPELVQCMQERVSAIEFPRFRQRRMRASFVIRVRGGAGEETAAPTQSEMAAIPPGAPWWTWSQRRASTSAPASTEPVARAWWERRPAPARPTPPPPTGPQVPVAGTTTAGGGTTATTSGEPAGSGGGSGAWWSGAGAEEGGEEVAPEEAPAAPPAEPTPPPPTQRGARGRRGRAQAPEAAPTPPAAPAQPTPPAAAPPPAQPTPPPAEENPWWAPAEG